jgi:ABC-type Mn2+/Zn2+ transport system ATPase subunit
MKFEIIDPLFLPHCGCHLQLTVNTGEVHVLVGDNGIGKSTFLHRIHLGMSSSSSVLVEQKEIDYFFDRKLRKLKDIFLESDLGMLDSNLFHSMWQMFGLSNKEDRFLSNLSGGESQALKLCLTLTKKADIYFLDEPSQFLDFSNKKNLLLVLDQLKSRGKSLILIEHSRDWFPAGWNIQELVLKDNNLQKGAQWIT